jgi:hypothetical protein
MSEFPSIALPIDQYTRFSRGVFRFRHVHVCFCALIGDVFSLFEELQQMGLISAITLSDHLIFLEFEEEQSLGVNSLLSNHGYVFCFDVESSDITSMFVKTTCWRLPLVHMGLHFALLNVPGFCRSPCIVFDISSNGDALLAAIPDRTSPPWKIKKSELTQFAFLENRTFQFDADDLTKVINLHYKGITIVKVSLNFLYVCEQHSHACLSELQAIFAFQRSECYFSYFTDFTAKFMRKLQVKEATCSPFDDVKSFATGSDSCSIPQIASGGDISEENKLSHELSP